MAWFNASSHPRPFFNHSLEGEQKSERHYEGMIKFMDNYVAPSICAMGCIGNILNLVILNRQKFRRSDGGKESGAHIGLTFLAVSDLLFCITLFPRFLQDSVTSFFTSKGFLLYYQMYGTGIITTCIFVSTWIIVAMAIVRYIAICFPLKVRSINGSIFSKGLYIGVSLTCIFINLPTFWEYTHTEGHGLYIIDIGYMNHHTPRGKAFLCVRVVLGTFIPALILTFCNLSLIRALKRSYRMRRECHVQQNGNAAKNRITLMLIVIVTSFVVFVFPSEVMEFFQTIIQENQNRTELFLVFRSFSNLLQTVNFSFNFVLYCMINVSFRSALCELLQCSTCKYRILKLRHPETTELRPMNRQQRSPQTRTEWLESTHSNLRPSASRV